MQYQPRTDWCYGCADRVGSRKFRQLTINNVCEDCDKRIKPENRIIESILEWEGECRRRGSNKCVVKNLKAQEIRKLERDKWLREEERQLIGVFNQLQVEMIGIWWRETAAHRLNWNSSKVKSVIKRVRYYNELKPVSVADHVLKFVSSDYLTARQIRCNFEGFTVVWICMTLEKLVKDKRIEKKVNRPYETLYRLLPIDYTIASKSLVTNRIEYGCV